MISKVLSSLPLADIDMLLIENVGSMVWPALLLLGEHKRVLIDNGGKKLTCWPPLRGGEINE